MLAMGLLALLLVVGGLGVLGIPLAHALPPAPAAANAPLTGTVDGPSVVGVNATADYLLNATGGPAYASNGTLVGNLTYYASVAASNTTGISVAPSFGAVPNDTNYTIYLTVGAVAEPMTLIVEYTSVYQTENVSLNVTVSINIVTPYVLTGEVVASNATVLPFSIAVYLDTVYVGSIPVPTLTPHQGYNFTFDYDTVGLSTGYHTFVLQMPSQHQQVHFPNGQYTYSMTFYITGPSPSYTLYYVLGAVAFVGVILISLILVGARRRGGTR